MAEKKRVENKVSSKCRDWFELLGLERAWFALLKCESHKRIAVVSYWPALISAELQMSTATDYAGITWQEPSPASPTR